MAKRKAKRRKPRKSSVRKSRKPFVGDQILAIYQLIASLIGIVLLSIVASIGLGFAFISEFKRDLFSKIHDKDVLAWLNSLSPTHGIVLFTLAGILLILALGFVRATWRGRKWAMWLHLLLNLPSATLAILLIQADSRLGSVLPIVISIYCLLRITGSVGPK